MLQQKTKNIYHINSIGVLVCQRYYINIKICVKIYAVVRNLPSLGLWI